MIKLDYTIYGVGWHQLSFQWQDKLTIEMFWYQSIMMYTTTGRLVQRIKISIWQYNTFNNVQLTICRNLIKHSCSCAFTSDPGSKRISNITWFHGLSFISLPIMKLIVHYYTREPWALMRSHEFNFFQFFLLSNLL